MTSPSKDFPVLSLPQASPSVSEDPFRAMLSTLIHETLNRELAQFLGARPFEGTPDRREVRNGYRRRQLTARIGKLELRIPRDRRQVRLALCSFSADCSQLASPVLPE